MNSERVVRRYRSDVALQPWSHARVWLFCSGVLLLLYGLSRDPAWVEGAYVEGFGSSIASWLGWLSAVVPFSVAEVLFVGLLVFEVWALFSAASEVGAGRRRVVNALAGGLLHTIDVVLLLGTWFYLAWGVAYARPVAAERFDLPVERVRAMDPEASAVMLRSATLRAIERVNEAYLAVHGGPDAGKVTVPREGLDVHAALERAFQRLGTQRRLGDRFTELRGRPKVPLTSPILSRLGVSGIYIPFTGEPHVNGGPPAWSQIETLAHEKAHQRMVAPEDEAGFVGFLALVHSDDPLLRYVGWQFARRQLQRAMVTLDPSSIEAVQGKLLPGPQRDIIALSEYWEPFRGPLQEAQGAMNDAYLRLNQVEGGIQSYGRAAALVVSWSETPEGRGLLFGTRGRPD